MTERKALDGKPYVGNLHVRFDEEEVASASPRRGAVQFMMDAMSYKTICLMSLLFGFCCSAAEKELKVSELGWNAENSTKYVQAALDSGVKRVIFDKAPGPWIVEPVAARSNTEIVFEDGVELQAKRGAFLGRYDSLMSFKGVTNVTLVGMGRMGGILRMHKLDYREAPYQRSEFRHALAMAGVENVLVENMSFVSSGGDGIEVHWLRGVRPACRNVTIRRCVCDDNHRQGISVVSAENLLIEDCVLKNTSGTAPQAGIDFEPDWNPHRLVNCVMRRCRVEGNAGEGVKVYVRGLDKRAVPLGIAVTDTVACDNAAGAAITMMNPPGGYVVFTNCNFSNGVNVREKNPDISLVFSDCTASRLEFLCGSWDDPVQDGIRLENFTFTPKKGSEWFAQRRSLVSAAPTNICGNVIVKNADGDVERISIDHDWCRRMFAPGSSGEPPPRVGRKPKGSFWRVFDSRPGTMVPMSSSGGGFAGQLFAFYVDKPGEVRFRLHCEPVTSSVLSEKKSFAGIHVGRGVYNRRVKPLFTLPAPDKTSREYPVRIKSPGMYYLFEPQRDLPLVIDHADVPVALDVRKGFKGRLSSGCEGVSAWLDVPEGTEKISVMARCGAMLAVANGHGLALALSVTDPAGMLRWNDDGILNMWKAFVSQPSPDVGLWKINVRPSAKGRSGQFTLDVSGVYGLLWLSPEKVVRMRR